MFLSSRKSDPVFILDPDTGPGILIFYRSRIPDPGVKKAPDPGSRIRNTAWKSVVDPEGCIPDPDPAFLLLKWWKLYGRYLQITVSLRSDPKIFSPEPDIPDPGLKSGSDQGSEIRYTAQEIFEDMQITMFS